MKLKVIYFSHYHLNISFYEQEEHDFFINLLLNILNEEKINDNVLIIDVLKDLFIPNELMYLFNNAFYSLLDNKLIKANHENFEKLSKKDLELTHLGEQSIKNNLLPIYEKSQIKEMIYNPTTKSLVALNHFDNDLDSLISDFYLNDTELNDLVNKFKNSLFPTIPDNTILNAKLIKVNPYLITLDLNKKDSGFFLKKEADKFVLPLIKQQTTHLNITKEKNITNPILLTNNFKFNLVIGEAGLNNLTSKYYLLINNEKAFQIENNLVYLPGEFNELINNENLVLTNSLETIQYNEVSLENKYILPLVNFSKNKYETIVKKWLNQNIKKFKNDSFIQNILNLFKEVK